MPKRPGRRRGRWRVPPLVSTIKLRQAGFGACIDTEECIVEHLEAMSARGYIPRH